MADVPKTIGGSEKTAPTSNNNQTGGDDKSKSSGRRGNRGRGGGNNTNKTAPMTVDYNNIDKAFKNDDSGELGIMYQRYFDCSHISDQVRFTDTVEKLQMYIGEKFGTLGQQIKMASTDPSKKPTVAEVMMPQKVRVDENGQTVLNKDGRPIMVDKDIKELNFVEQRKLEARIKKQIDNEDKLQDVLGRVHDFIFRRCTAILQDKIKAHKRFDAVHKKSDPFELLAMIREIMHKVESTAYLPLSIIEQQDTIFRMQQGSLSVSQYHTHFKSMMDALSSQGGDISHHAGITKMVAKEMFDAGVISTDDVTALSDSNKIMVMEAARNRYVAALFVKLADPHRFGDLLLSLKDDYTSGINKFPSTLQKAVELLQGRENNRQERWQTKQPRQRKEQAT